MNIEPTHEPRHDLTMLLSAAAGGDPTAGDPSAGDARRLQSASFVVGSPLATNVCTICAGVTCLLS